MCQRWRSVLFASSRYFDLKVFCTYGTPAREVLSTSLDFPIIVRYGGFPESNLLTADDEDGVIALLDHPGRLFEVQITATAPILEKMATVGLTQQPFSALEYLHLSTRTETGLVLPSEFGGTPGLRTLWMIKIALPALPRLLLLAPNLVSLRIEEIPSIGYTLEALLICLPAMTRLKTLRIHFLFPSSRPALLSTLQSTERRSVLPCLNHIEFHGTSEYLECLLSTITTPYLKYIRIAFFNQLIFHTPQLPQLSQFILRTETQRSPNQATIHYSGVDISLTLSHPGRPHYLALRILCKNLDWQISSMTELCEGLSQTLFHVEQLNICASPTSFAGERDEMDFTQLEFLDLFRQFVHVRRLCVTGGSALHVVGALRPVTGQLAVIVLPELREIYVGKDAELAFARRDLSQFIATRGSSTRPVLIRSLEAELSPEPNFETLCYSAVTMPTGIYHLKSYYILIPEVEDQNIQIPEVEDQNIQIPEVGDQNIPGHLRRNPHLLAILDLVGSSHRVHLDIHPSQELEVNLLQRLACPPAFGGQFPGASVQTISILELLVRSGMVAMYERLSMKRRREIFAMPWTHFRTTAACQNTPSSPQSILVARPTTPLLYTFGLLGPRLVHMPLEYSPYLIERGQLELAVETIEQGREWIWSEISELRSPIGRLWRVNPDLAHRLEYFNQALEAINIPISTNQDDADTFKLAFEELQRVVGRHQEVIQRIRALEGFANFMTAMPFPTLQSAATHGPIIIINHCRWRCDILIVLHNSPPSLIPTNEGFYRRTSNLAGQLKEARHKHGLDSKDFDQVLVAVLAELYELVGKPVISRLRELGIPEKSRIWWYPTSVFWSLPLHAMGPVPSDDGYQQYFSDLYVCSYTPTLRALMQSRRFAAPKRDPPYSLLLVAQPDFSLPNIWGEIQAVQNLDIPVTTLLSELATPSAIVESLRSHTLVHFACHGTLEAGKPLDAGIELYGGDRLTLRDIANSRLPPAEFAFLSVCHSAEPTDADDPTKGLNFAAAMQSHGFGSVVGTMWALPDKDGGDIAQNFYRRLLSNGRRSHGVPLGEISAEALQFAVRKLRRKRGMTLERWVCWVHYGA